MPQPLDYRSHVPAAPVPQNRLAAAAVAGAFVLTNAVLVAVAASRRDWAVLGEAASSLPLTNFVLALVAFACTPLIQLAAPRREVGLYVGLTVCLPFAAVVIDFLLLLVMGLRDEW